MSKLRVKLFLALIVVLTIVLWLGALTVSAAMVWAD